MRNAWTKRLALAGLIFGLTVLAGGCSFFGLSFGKREIRAGGSAAVRTWEGRAEELTVKNVSLSFGLVTGEGPEVILKTDGGKSRVEISAASELLEILEVDFHNGSLTIGGKSI